MILFPYLPIVSPMTVCLAPQATPAHPRHICHWLIVYPCISPYTLDLPCVNPRAGWICCRADSWASSIALFISCCHWSSHCFLPWSTIFLLCCSSTFFCLYAASPFTYFTVILALPSKCSSSLLCAHSCKNSPLSCVLLAPVSRSNCQHSKPTTVLFVLVSKTSERSL